MAEPIYFQWQNEFLLRTIYPLRETKLRDFLVYTREIDLWNEYKTKTIESIPAEVAAYRAERKQRWDEAVEKFESLQAYFASEDVSADYLAMFPDVDQEFLNQINSTHQLFKKYFLTYNNPRKEKYFITERIRQLEEKHKATDHDIADKQRIVRNMGTNWAHTLEYEHQIVKLRDVTLKMIDRELAYWYAFLSAYSSLEKPKLALASQKAKLLRDRSVLDSQLRIQQTNLQTVDSKLAQLEREIRRFFTPTDIEALKAYFLTEDVTSFYQQKFTQVDQLSMGWINGIHREFKKYFPTYNNTDKEKYYINARVQQLETLKNMLPKTNLVAQQMAAEELSRIYDLQFAYENLGKTVDEVNQQIAQKQLERASIQSQRVPLLARVSDLEEQINQLDARYALPEKHQMAELIQEQEPTVKDIYRSRIEEYQESLSTKDQGQLLELVVSEFMQDPARYPLWLQYMVVHFSGMRYQSAHGSWADPKELLLSLRIKAIDDELKLANDEAIQALCEDSFHCYQPSAGQDGVEPGQDEEKCTPTPLSQTDDPVWRRKIEYHLRALDPLRVYGKRKALLDLRIDEESYEIEKTMTDQQALDELEEMKSQLPDWMWKEVVKLTDLKLTEVKDQNWENLSADDLEARQSRQMAQYREMMDQWERDNLTGWREEHDRTNRLIVTRAVCNEVAEQIQHIRGNSPPGGLTAKPEWYLRKEKDPQLAGGHPYFVKPHVLANFTPGASILWLRWVDDPPNAWRIAHPITLKNGEGLLPIDQSPTGWVSAIKKTVDQAEKSEKSKLEKDPTAWGVRSDGSGFMRTRTLVMEGQPKGPLEKKSDQPHKKTTVKQTQWLRWMHEATVAQIAETADGPIVMTFETALPDDDRRQSTIGVFKHSAGELYYSAASISFTGTFIGYTPEGDVPYADLKEMLDWNHILNRAAYTPAQIQAYWDKAILKPPLLPAGEQVPGQPPPGVQTGDGGVAFEVAPPISKQNHKEWIVCYTVSAGNQQVYQPRVELKRGVQIFLSKAGLRKVGMDTFYPVTRCEAEPRAQDLFVLASEVIEAPPGSSSLPVAAKTKINLRQLVYANNNGKPVIVKGDEQLPAGARFRISTVHKITGADQSGVIHADGNLEFYLIVECPDKVSAQGHFVAVDEVTPISEAVYAQAG